ncbi:MAG: YhjD/YihY/BrkB family envelope integrity protein [Nostocoides sp.]|uniref:YhjD/YihY/BrkB family envelope integrity protein n=1 Tax=Nostocoides sp. TaxID=1917966 RepID=UPI003C70CD58
MPLPSPSSEWVAGARDSFLGRCVHRFLEIRGIDRSMVLSSQAFTALIPLLILTAAVAPRVRADQLSQHLIRRFGLEGEAASALTALFAIPDGAPGGLGIFSAVLLLFSGASFALRLQAMYRAAWRQEKVGARGGAYAALGLLVILIEVLVLSGARAVLDDLPWGWALTVPASLLLGVLLWTSIPYVLLGRAVPWRRLVFGGAVAALGTTAYAAATSIYMPGLLNRYSTQFGLFGVTIALIGWLLAIAGILTASAVIGSEFDSARGTIATVPG